MQRWHWKSTSASRMQTATLTCGASASSISLTWTPSLAFCSSSSRIRVLLWTRSGPRPRASWRKPKANSQSRPRARSKTKSFSWATWARTSTSSWPANPSMWSRPGRTSVGNSLTRTVWTPWSRDSSAKTWTRTICSSSRTWPTSSKSAWGKSLSCPPFGSIGSKMMDSSKRGGLRQSSKCFSTTIKGMKLICSNSMSSAGVSCQIGKNMYFLSHLGPKTEAIRDFGGTDGSILVVLPLFSQELQKVHPQERERRGKKTKIGRVLHWKTRNISLI